MPWCPLEQRSVLITIGGSTQQGQASKSDDPTRLWCCEPGCDTTPAWWQGRNGEDDYAHWCSAHLPRDADGWPAIEDGEVRQPLEPDQWRSGMIPCEGWYEVEGHGVRWLHIPEMLNDRGEDVPATCADVCRKTGPEAPWAIPFGLRKNTRWRPVRDADGMAANEEPRP